MNISITKSLILLAFLPIVLHAQNVENHLVGVNQSITLDYISEFIPLSISEAPEHGTYEVTSEPYGTSPNGLYHLTYTPNQDYLGPDTMVISLQDPTFPTLLVKTLAFNVVEATVTAVNDFYTMEPNETRLLEVLNNDFGTGSPYLEVVSLSNNLSTETVGNEVEATISNDYSGIAKFSYTCCVENEVCDIGIVSIFVQSENTVIDSVRLGTNKGSKKTLLSPLDNGYQIVNAPNHGTVNDFDGGSFKYEPNSFFLGIDTFTLAYNTASNTSLRTFIIDVFDTYEPTTFVFSDKASIAVGATETIDVLANDQGIDLILQSISLDPLNGSASIVNGEIVYEADPGFSGVEHIRYKACTPQFDCEITDLFVFVNNQLPSQDAFDLITPIGTSVVIEYPAAIEGWNYQIENLTTDSGGTLEYHEGEWSGVVNGQNVEGYNLLVYSPPTDWVGVDDFNIDYCFNNDCYGVMVTANVIADPNATVDPHCSFDCVFPGDADANGKVDIKDILSIGYCAGEVGPERVNPDQAYYGQHAENWAVNAPGSNVNLKHIDADGDGKVMSEDRDIVDLFYGQGNGLSVTANPSTVDHPIYFVTTTQNPGPGDLVNIDILLGAEATPAIDVAGISFSLNYNTDIVKDGTFKVDFYTESWLAYDCPVMDFVKTPVLGKVDAAYTRVAGTMASGFGVVGTASFIIEDQIDGIKQGKEIELKIELNDANAMNGAGELVSMEANEIIIPISLRDKKEGLNPDQMLVYPNPVESALDVHLNGNNNFRSVEVVDISGRRFMYQQNDTNHIEMNVAELMDGLYFLRAVTDKGFITKKFQVIKK